uniref:Uncharacterized protein n=1 Tax=Salix viminalis TaxID=40686 RepID=A0A6N2MWF1_SALVM
MGGYSRQRKSSSCLFSIFSIFKSCWHSNGSDDMSEDGFYGRRVCPGDDDGKQWTGEPGIDGRASAFIARFYATRVSDPERQTLSL